VTVDLAGLLSLEGQTALVTGASRGIGRAIAIALGGAGARVVVTARSVDGLLETKSAIESDGGQAVVVPADLDDDGELQRLFEAATAAGDGVDVLVNNAAAHRLAMLGPSHRMPMESFDATVRTNLRAPFLLTQLVVNDMIERGNGGSIVHVTSVSQAVGAANLAAYSATKAAIARWAEASAAEWGAYDIRVNCVAPGLTETEAARGVWGDPAVRAKVEATTCLGRLGQPEDVGLATLFLASKAAGYITGQTLYVDGGTIVGTLAGDRKPPRPATSS
jgi:NAD(P)-dependent dehydrogenase (short-subunit alcohol dehydrogenase family)